MRQNNSQKGIIWSSSQPLCPGYPSSTSVPLDEAKWDQLLSEGPHQIAGFHPPTTLIWGSSLALPLSITDFHRRSHSCGNCSTLTWETINHYSFFFLQFSNIVMSQTPKKPIRSLLMRFSSGKCPTSVNVGMLSQNYLGRWEWFSIDFNYRTVTDFSYINAWYDLQNITPLLTLHTTVKTFSKQD